MRDDRDRLADVVEAADRIAMRVARGRQRFNDDEDVQLAVVRLLEIVGEACANVSVEVRQGHPTVPWSAAAGMRNRVIHGYFDVDLDLVWNAAEYEVPALAVGVKAAIDDLTAEKADD